jgi:acyl dehydratase
MPIPSVEAAKGHRTVTHASVSSFGTLTGDYARMHFDHHHGKESPIAGSIAHGLLSASWAVGMLTRFAPERVGVGDPQAVVGEFSTRFHRMVYVGDTLCLHDRDGDEGGTAWEILNQEGDVATSGTLRCTTGELPAPPRTWPLEDWTPPPPGDICYAEDLPERGPRGEGVGRTITESEVVGFATEVGETNPLYLNRVFAEGARFGERIAPPMLTFCLSFSDYLDALLSMPLPSTGFAGHLGDSWRFHAPVAIGDTIRGRYRTLSATPSKSRPEMAVVEFGLQVLNQHDVVVQQGSVMMMIARRGHRSV